MKKTLGLFAALAVTFLMSADVYSSSGETGNNGRAGLYCAYQWYGYCEHAFVGTACYLVDADCNWIDDQTPPED